MNPIRQAIRKLSGPKPDPINTEPSPTVLGIRMEVMKSEDEYRRVLPRGRYGFRNSYPDGTQDWTVIY